MTTLAEVISSTMDLVNLFDAREDEMRDWWAGTATGGPNGDGLYPMTDSAGVTTFFPSIAKVVSQIEQGVDGLDAGIRYTFSGTTTDANPGAGKFRMNNSTFASVTYLYVSTTEAGGAGVSSWLDTLDDSTEAVKGKLMIRQGSSAFGVFKITGNIVSATGYKKIPVEPIAYGGAFLDSQDVTIVDSQTGPQGQAGTQFFNGTTAPSNALGSNGDYYINTVSKMLYGPKAAGAWPAGISLKGDKGDTGDTGSVGPTAWAQAVPWATATAYQAVAPANVVTIDGSTYLCIVGHLSGTFSTDLAAGKWLLIARKGIDGAGTGNVNPSGTIAAGAVAVFADSSGTTIVDGGKPGVANGFATLDATGKVPMSQLDVAVLGGLNYKGTWNASTNSPAIPTAAIGNKGWYYKVSTAGTTTIDGQNDWGVGDWIVSNGTAWDKIDNSETVQSVAGKTGVVTLVKGDVGLGNVDNTSDANKPVSTAQQTALDLKLNISAKATTTQATTGTDDTAYMTPAKVKSAIDTFASAVTQTSFEVEATGTGSPQTITIPFNVGLDKLLIFENGLEQSKTGITKPTTTSIQGTFLNGAKIRVVLPGGYAGQSFKVDVFGPLSGRSAYDSQPYGFVFGDTSDSRLGLYIRKATSGWDGPYYVQGDPGVVTYSNATPANLGAGATPGTANEASRSDHVHKFPLAVDGTTFTAPGALASTDHGKVVIWNASSGNLTLPATFEKGFNCIVYVEHATGVPTFVAASGATIRQADSYTKARKRYSEVSARVHSNSDGSSAIWVLSGDMS